MFHQLVFLASHSPLVPTFNVLSPSPGVGPTEGQVFRALPCECKCKGGGGGEGHWGNVQGEVYEHIDLTQMPRLGHKDPGRSWVQNLWEAEQILEEAPHLPSCLSAGSREDRCKMLRGMHPPVPNCPPSPGVFSRATSHTNQQSQILGQPYCTTPGGPFTWATGSGQAVGKWGSRPHRDLGRNVSRGLLC